ncbi:peptidoglycan recognition protein-like [Anopheles ziemanni]|uniref:peptidoglycan recognition protein-like n=1 Tax=Anopheles coustani TaxID=139045 RepID=UPI002659833C|nr:peptidoglycan recognition protein-like [Anopheles coustani]XP_058176155.1 peptidoglycan recognition protein-like [Anopheles ziemanni]
MVTFGDVTSVVLLCGVLVSLQHGVVVAQDAAPESACMAGVVKRSAWGAAKSTNVTYQLKPVPTVIVHHTTGDRCMSAPGCRELVRNIQTYHQTQNGWSDIGYNFLIGSSFVYEGIGWHRAGAHLRGRNDKSIGVAFIGNYDLERPTARQLQLLNTLLQCGVELGELSDEYRLYGAMQLQSTNSPGKFLHAKLQEHDHWREDI